MIDSQIGKVKFGQKFKAGSKQAVVSVPYVIRYHPKLKKIAQVMKKLEYQDESLKRLFTPPPMVSYRSARKRTSYLFSAIRYLPSRKEKRLLELYQFEKSSL